MSLWRHQAFEQFPELRTELQETKTVMGFWIELGFAFNDAYRMGNIDLFKRILDYADWSIINTPRGKEVGDDPPSCIHVAFFEHMPPASREDTFDRIALGRELLTWGGPSISHPYVKALLQNLIERQAAKA